MAEATQATPATTTVTPPTTTGTPAQAAAVTTATPAPAQGATTATVAPIAQPAEESGKERKLTAFQRAELAIAKVEGTDGKPVVAPAVEKPAEVPPSDAKADPTKATADAKKPEDEAAKKAADEASAKAAKDAEDKAKAEQAAKDNPRLSKALAIVAERERRVALRERELTGKLDADRRAFEAEKVTWTQSRAADEEDLKFVRNAREALRTGGKPAVARMFGLTVEELVDYKSREVEPRPEDIISQAEARAKEAAERRFAELMTAREEADAKAQREAAEKNQAAETVRATEFVMKAVELHNADTTKRPWLARTPVTGEQLWKLAGTMRDQLGRDPTQVEVLDKAEETIRAQYAPLAAPISATPPPPAPVPPPSPAAPVVEATKQPQLNPAEQPRGRTKRVSPLDRAAAILRSRGLDT